VIAAYLRVSTKDQKTDSQRAEIDQWRRSHGIRAETVTWYEDRETGATLDRPAFEQLQKDIFAGKIKTVIIWKLDRLSRKLRDGVNLLADWTEKSVRIVVVTQQLDLSGPVGRMIAAVMLGLAEIEREHIRERQKAGIALARKRGAYKGRKPGARKASPQRARELAAKGNKAPEIAKSLGISVRSVTRYLRA
jgi:DNA invertase Pin-like site-specific DNA recombinase